MQDFVHLHVHSQYSLLDGQASIPRLVDKAIADGMRGIAITDHGNMFAIKEFWNYVKKKNGARKDKIKELKSKIEALQAELESADSPTTEQSAELAKMKAELDSIPKEDFKAIIGCEVYVARRAMHLKEEKQDQSGYHLILLAKNKVGYHNLIKIVSRAWTEGYYMRPRTDRSDIEKYHEGLICCSACLGGEVPKRVTNGDMEAAEEAVQWYKSIFGEDYYLELQLHKATVERANHEAYELQKVVNEKLLELSDKYGVKLVCTNDVHFVDEENAEAHDRLICLSTGRDLDDPKRMLYSKQEWMKTRQEMNAIFEDVPESLTNTVKICDQVESYSIDHAPIMPTFEIPEEFGTEEGYRAKYSEQDLFNEFTRDENGNVVMEEDAAHKKIDKLGGYDKLYRIKLEADYLAHLTMIGAKKRYGDPLSDEVRELLKFELHIMKTMGFPGYFLIVQDFIRAAREELDVSVGPGRGSAAGSAVAYCLGITQIDPVKYDLLFERFLNPDRISLPDIDIDFDDDGRGRVLNWVTQKYGKEKVAHIITYGTMATKMALKDVARVQKLPLPESDRLCKLVPDRIPDKKINLKNAIEYVPELKAAEQSEDPIMHDTIKYAKMLEGNVRGTGVHACGTIICRDDITDWVPVSTAEDKETGEKMLVTQYEGAVIEDTGLIKMDFLGLKTLSIIKDAVANVKHTRGIEVDIDTIDIDDPVTYKLYCAGRTVGTFQFESPGMQKYLRELQPSTFEDLIAMNALYRPGPMDYIPDFIDRKHGRKPIVYDIPVMEKYLKDTYGITVYQEQVMLLSRLLGNFTRGESDTLRKAMGKKIKSKLDELKPKFIKGGQDNGHDPDVLEKIWADWEKFASYAFNKSHATCYSWVAYQTAYLKANYPSEYMAAVLSRNLADIKTITQYMTECKHMGINVLGPDINESEQNFSANKAGDIRFGMAAIKGVGEAAVKSIIDEREKNGAYKDIYDFMERVNYTLVNRKCLENIAYAGGFDSITEFSRSKFFAVDDKNAISLLEQLARYGQRVQQEKANAQQSLFGGGSAVDIQRPSVPVADEWNQLQLLNKEREVIGLYLSAHPLDEYKVIIDHMCKAQLSDLADLERFNGQEIAVSGVVTSVQALTTKTGRPWGRFTIEDYQGTHEFALFGKDYEKFRQYLYKDYFLFVKGKVQPRPYGDNPELEFKIQHMMQLDEVRDKMIKEVHLTIPVEELTASFVQEFSEKIISAQGKRRKSEQKEKSFATLRVAIVDRKMGVTLNMYSRKYKVELTRDLVDYFDSQELKYTLS
ncbi:MAG: DNA polymerase III subunit alpha [Rikenellaceae bacterium]|nr:DNA polymerase III subunit alpha [Rikenellaceae bacterium]